MIVHLKGILAEIELEYIVVDINGVGYQVFVHSRTFNQLPAKGEKVFIYTHLQITDSEYKLFGFLEKDEKKLFEKIISVSGMGAKAALSTLSTMEPYTFYNAIISQDEKTLTTIPGIGKKSAARLIFELKDKLDDLTLIKKEDYGVNINELIEAMEVLGYRSHELMPLINEMSEQGALQSDTGINIKLLLQKINEKKR